MLLKKNRYNMQLGKQKYFFNKISMYCTHIILYTLVIQFTLVLDSE